MAANQKQSMKRNRTSAGGQKKSTKAKTNGRAAVNREEENPYRDEIILIVTMVVSVLLILSNFNLCGAIFGPFFKKLLFGLFGVLAYIFPFFLFLSVAFAVSNRGNHTARRKLVSTAVLFIILTGLLQLIGTPYNPEIKLTGYYSISAREYKGGGLFGGIISRTLCTFVGEIGAYVVLIGILLLLFMFISEKLLFAGLGKKSARTMEQIKEHRRIREEEMEAAIERGELPRRKARTFTFSKTDRTEYTDEAKEEVPAKKSKKKAKKEQSTGGKAEKENEQLQSGSLPVYEEELINKFSNTNSSNESVFSGTDYIDLFTACIEEEGTGGVPAAETAVREGLPADSVQEPALYVAGAEDKPAAADIWSRNDGTLDEPAPEAAECPDIQSESAYYNKNDRIRSDKIVSEKARMAAEVQKNLSPVRKEAPYIFPSADLLNKPKPGTKNMSDKELKITAVKLQSTLESFGVRVTITNVSCGPTVTRYELQPEQGVKVSKITGLADDIKLNLAAADIRIEAPIPGKAAVGIEVPNKENATVMFRELLESREFKNHPSNIAFAVGKDIGGQTVVTDIAKMPHLLIAGATGSGKSVCINTLIMSILYKANPEDVKLIMVDPKVVELSVYNGIPHLLIPVVTDPKKASAALNWAVVEMTDRYKRFADFGVRDLKGYNEKAALLTGEEAQQSPKMPQIVIIVDELADLMMVAPGEVEESICRLAQLARAAGIHLIIATQRPSVNVITGLIKANIPSRIAFSVSSAIDSRTILDGAGAEKLLGKGDMLFFPSGIPKPVRVQGAFVSDKEVSNVVEFLTSKMTEPVYNTEVADKITSTVQAAADTSAAVSKDRDEYFEEAGRYIIEKDKASIGMLQRVYKIGFNRAARIMDQLFEAGVVAEEEGTKPRKILMTLEEFEQMLQG